MVGKKEKVERKRPVQEKAEASLVTAEAKTKQEKKVKLTDAAPAEQSRRKANFDEERQNDIPKSSAHRKPMKSMDRAKAIKLLKEEEDDQVEEEKHEFVNEEASDNAETSVKQVGRSKDSNDHKKQNRERQPLPSVPAGTVVVGRVDLENAKIRLPVGSLLVQFRGGLGKRYGIIDLTQVRDQDKWVDNPFDAFKHGQFVKCVVLKSNPSATPSFIVQLSMRPSLVEVASNSKDENAKRELFDAELLESNQVPAHDSLATGFVVGANEKGCFIRVSRNLTGRVLLKNLSQGFVKDIAGEFPVGKLVAGRVLSADKTSGKFELTLRSSAVVGESEQRWAWNTLTSGTIVDGVVHKIIPAGVLVNLPSAGGLTGLCHLTQVFDEDVMMNNSTQSKRKGKKRTHKSDGDAGEGAVLDEERKQQLRQEIARAYHVGDMVKCLVLELDPDAKRLQLGMKPSYFQSLLENNNDEVHDEQTRDDMESEGNEPNVGDDEESDDDNDGEDQGEADEDDEGSNDEGDEEDDDAEKEDDEEDAQEDSEEDAEGEDDEPITLQDALKQSGVALKFAESNSVQRTIQKTKQEMLQEADDNDEHKSSRLNNKRRDALKRKAEATTSELEDRLVSDAAPETVEEFERSLVSKKNSSVVWIEYISLLVSMGDMEKARAIGERAVKSISPELEDERNNVWSALLTMELQFGTLDLAKQLFSRMIKACDEKWAYLTLCDTYWSLPASYPDRLKLAEEAIRGAKKASKQQSAKVWLRHFTLKFDAGEMVEGRKLLKEALRFVPKHKQVKVMLGFARLEFSHENGDKERGRTIMEGILDNYPKRTDVWHVFIDLEIKYGTADRVRTLFERALGLKMSTKKVKSLFKKWLQFESGPKGGGEAYMESVKERARKFVESLVGEDAGDEDDL